MTSTMVRTDIHRPSAPEFDPDNYEVFDYADFHETDGYRPLKTINRLLSEGWSFGKAPHGSGQCSHCGARLRYAALMGHVPTKTLLYVGETCLDNRFSMTAGEFKRMREQGRLNAERRTRDEKIAAVLADHPVLVWGSYARNIEMVGAEYLPHDEYEGYAQYKYGTSFGDKIRATRALDIMSDIWWKVEKYGSVSDSQATLVERLVSQVTEKAEAYETRQAEIAAKVEAGVAVPTGRIVVEGEVAITKWVANDFGGSFKMMVVNDEGWKVWGTVPRSLDIEKGDRVRFTATVEQSNDDALFGFYKRPTKAEKI